MEERREARRGESRDRGYIDSHYSLFNRRLRCLILIILQRMISCWLNPLNNYLFIIVMPYLSPCLERKLHTSYLYTYSTKIDLGTRNKI